MPPSVTDASDLPVVVYFHGGGFTSGDNTITPSMHSDIGQYMYLEPLPTVDGRNIPQNVNRCVGWYVAFPNP